MQIDNDLPIEGAQAQVGERVDESPVKPVFRYLGLQPYEQTFAAMRKFTDERDEHTADEIWCVEHEAVYTQGQAGSPAHLIDVGGIPLVKSDRGGQVTYHGPGQLVVYLLLNLKRYGLGVRRLVDKTESAIIDYLSVLHIQANADPKAPGVYVEGKKIASLGFRIRKHCSYHGLALNVDMDLSPFAGINPCGYQGLQMTQIKDFVTPAPSMQDVAHGLRHHIIRNL